MQNDKPFASDELNEALRRARERWDGMTPEEQRAELDRQRESWVRAELSWPAPRYTWVNGVKVYESYEDYVNG